MAKGSDAYTSCIKLTRRNNEITTFFKTRRGVSKRRNSETAAAASVGFWPMHISLDLNLDSTISSSPHTAPNHLTVYTGKAMARSPFVSVVRYMWPRLYAPNCPPVLWTFLHAYPSSARDHYPPLAHPTPHGYMRGALPPRSDPLERLPLDAFPPFGRNCEY